MYRDFGQWLQQLLGCKCQKIGINAGFSCPNRDGTVGTGGCTFCNNQTFSPAYCRPEHSVTHQLEDGKRFFAHKYPNAKYIAYFQAYTSTHAAVERCIALYEEALAVEDVVGIIIATRPDCMPPALLDYLQQLSRRTFVLVEYGVESANDLTLQRIHRGHTFATAAEAIRRTAARGIHVGAHIILGLPGEDYDELMRQADVIGQLPLTTLKFHQLQIIRGTAMERDFAARPWPIFTVEEYVHLVADYLQHLPVDIIIDRFATTSSPSLRIAPRWGLRNKEIAQRVQKIISNASKTTNREPVTPRETRENRHFSF